MSNSELIDELRKKIATAREKYKTADDNIKRLNTSSFNSPRTPGRLNDISSRGSLLKRNLSETPSGPEAKRANFTQITFRNEKSNNENEIEIKADEDTRTVISSSVVRVEKSRKDAIQDMKHCENADDKQRGRRMFGVLLTTLAKFKTEADTKPVAKQDKALQRIEEKIAESKKEEKEILKREKQELINEKMSAETEIRLLQEQIRMTEIFETWKKEIQRTKSYIRTETKPYIYYRPKQPSSESDKRLANSCKAIDDMIDSKKAKLDATLAKLAEESKSRMAARSTSMKSSLNTKKHHSETGNLSSSSSRAPSPNLEQSDNEKVQALKSSVVQSSKQVEDDNESEMSEGQDDIVLESAEQTFNGGLQPGDNEKDSDALNSGEKMES